MMYLRLRERATDLAGASPAASWETVTPSHGVSWMRSTGEYPNVAVESTLSQILMDSAPEKYSLSARACEGILLRARERGKELPPRLREALEEALKYTT